MTRRFIPSDGVLRKGFYWVAVEGRPDLEVAFWNEYVWYLAGEDKRRRGLVPLSKPLVAPR